MVADLANTGFLLLGANWKWIHVIKATQADWINLDSVKGVLAVIGSIQATAAVTAELPFFGTVTVNNKGTAYTATSVSIVIDGALATRLPPYYLRSSTGEIMEVSADSTPAGTGSTLTIKRGLFGTTAAATGLADDNVLTVMNQINLSSSGVGCVDLIVALMPGDGGAILR